MAWQSSAGNKKDMRLQNRRLQFGPNPVSAASFVELKESCHLKLLCLYFQQVGSGQRCKRSSNRQVTSSQRIRRKLSSAKPMTWSAVECLARFSLHSRLDYAKKQSKMVCCKGVYRNVVPRP